MISLIRKYLSRFRYSAWLLEGTEKHSNADLQMLFVGSNEQNKNYIANLVYKPLFHEIYIGRFWLLRPLRFKHKIARKSDMVVTELKKRHMDDAKKPSFFIPCWIDGKFNIDETLRLTESDENLKKEMHRIRKCNYTYEVLREREKFVEFYYQMYVPYLKKIYGNKALYHSLDGILRRFESSELLLVKDGQVPVTGIVIKYKKHGPKLFCLGVLNGDRCYVKAGAIAAIYYFSLLHLKKKGYIEIELGTSRGFLNDGVLKYKKKWGMHLTALRNSGFLIHQLTLNTGTRGFLLNNPFIISKANGLSVVFFSTDSTALTTQQQKKIIKAFAINGVNKLLVCPLHCNSPVLTFSETSPVPVEIRHINDQKDSSLKGV